MGLASISVHPLRVLIVEDNRDGADTLAMLLQRYGFDVQVAYTGPDGLSAALADPPDAVVCDINLPGLDGLTIARRLREALPEKPFLVAVTALREEDLIEPAGRAGFDHYFAKPADPAELGGLLTELAERG